MPYEFESGDLREKFWPQSQGLRRKKILGEATKGPEIFGGAQRPITVMLFTFLYPQKGGHGPRS